MKTGIFKTKLSRLTRLLMVLNLQILLLVPNCMNQKMETGVKTGDQYWKETGLGSKEFEEMISNISCYLTQQTFLSCSNAVSQMAEKFGLMLGLDGKLKIMAKADIEQRTTEKKILAQWISFYQRLQISAPNSQPISFLKLWKQLEKEYVKSNDRAAVIAAGINGFLSVYKDPHTYIMPLAMYEEVIASSETKSTSAGFVAKRYENFLIVRKVFDGSPAAKAGFRRGDRIMAINGEKISETLPAKVSEVLRMRDSRRLGFTVERITGGQTEEKYLEVSKLEVIYPAVSSKMLEGKRNMGLLTLNKFSKNTCTQVAQQLQSLKEQAVEGIMLDLRDNPGGQVDEAACVLNLFVAKGTLMFETRYMDPGKQADRYVALREPMYNGPLVVLINSGSASAAEIVAGGLREQKRAKLVGERSFGKGSFQDGRTWGPNPKIALFQTEGLYYFPSGWTPQLTGLAPDLQVNFYDGGNQREQELFLNPIMPPNNWSGPQTLSWLGDRDCDLDMAMAVEQNSNFEDPQMQKAQAWMSCGDNHDRHGSL